jgi:uncharacterized membrane protein YoaK (UPF0700 family)
MRDKALKVVLVVLGLLFTAAIYPTIGGLRNPNDNPGDTMMMSIYLALGVFLLLAARNPAEHRSLILFTAWSGFAHGAVMAVFSYKLPNERTSLYIAAVVLGVVGIALIGLLPGKANKAMTAVSG